MAKNEVKETEELSKSRQKRAERQKEVARAKKQKAASKIISIVIAIAVVAVIVVAAGLNIYKSATRTKSSEDYSKGLTDEGKIDGVNPLDYITLADYKNLVIPKAEISATDEEIENDIKSALEAHKELSEDPSVKAKDGDKVNIDYVGSIDGVEFEGGNSNGEGYDLEIGSNSFIDNFEEQLIGHSAGEEVTVKVTFPEDYQAADLAGKAAEFAVTVHGVYVTPELTDEFVKENFGDKASTVEEYRNSIADGYYNDRLTSYITNYIKDNTTANKYPNSYVKTLKSVLKANDEYTLSYYNQMFAQYGMSYNNLWDLVDGAENEDDYEKDLTKRAQESCAEALAYQAIFEAEGLSLDMDAYYAEISEGSDASYIDNMKETYGIEYMSQMRMRDVVTEYLKENANVQ